MLEILNAILGAAKSQEGSSKDRQSSALSE